MFQLTWRSWEEALTQAVQCEVATQVPVGPFLLPSNQPEGAPYGGFGPEPDVRSSTLARVIEVSSR